MTAGETGHPRIASIIGKYFDKLKEELRLRLTKCCKHTLAIFISLAICVAMSILPGCSAPNHKLPMFYQPSAYPPLVMSQEKQDQAMKNADMRVSKDKNDFRAHVDRGGLQFYSGEYRAAISEYGDAIQIMELRENPDNAAIAQVYVKRGITYWRVKQFENSISDYTRAIELSPKDWEPYFHRWQTYRRIGDIEKAERDRQIGRGLNLEVFDREYSFKGGVL